MSKIACVTNDEHLDSGVFLTLVQRVWPGDYYPALVQAALRRTLNVTAWDGDRLVGSVRILTDGYFFGTIPEILVDPGYQGQGIGSELMKRAWELAPTSLFFGAQPGKEAFYERLGYNPSLPSYVRKKARPKP